MARGAVKGWILAKMLGLTERANWGQAVLKLETVDPASGPRRNRNLRRKLSSFWPVIEHGPDFKARKLPDSEETSLTGESPHRSSRKNGEDVWPVPKK